MARKCEECTEWEYRPLEQEPTTKNDLAVEAPILHLEPDNCGNYVVQSIPVKLNITEIKKHQSDFSDLEQEPKTGYLSINDVMSVFDDFMRGDVDEADTETFFEMLKDKAESEVEDGNDD